MITTLIAVVFGLGVVGMGARLMVLNKTLHRLHRTIRRYQTIINEVLSEPPKE